MKSLLIIVSLFATVCVAFAQTNVIFPRQGTLWKYDQTNDLYTDTGGTGWTLLTYDDSGPSWQEGPALLSSDTGNGNIAPLIQTVIPGPRVIPPTQHARFFRKKFTYNDPVAAFTQLRMNRRFDDGAIIWLNGIEIGRVNWTSFDPPTFTQRSECYSCSTPQNCTSGGDADCEEVSLFPADALIQGENIIAISIHQTAADSSDITFGTSLEVVLPKAPTIISNSEPADRTVFQNRSTTLSVYAEASPAPTYQWYYSTTGEAGSFTPITDATNSSYTIASMQSVNEGYYYVTVANVISSVDSRIAHVIYTEDNIAPLMLSVSGSGKFDTVLVVFDEAMDPVTVGDNFNWAVTGPEGALTLLDPVAATLSADGKIATVAFASGVLLQENTVYTVSVSGVADSTGINFITDTNLSFTSYVRGCDTFLFEAFDTASTPGNAITLLTSHPNYPTNPRDVANMAGLDSRYGYPDNSHEQFGMRIRGLFVPPISGAWVFYLASDDAGQLFLNPNGPDSAGKTLVAEETGCCNNFTTPPSPRTSTPQNLTAGQAYYMEALCKEGTGGDWLKVAARLAGEPTPVGGNSDNAGLSPNAIQGSAGPGGILSFVTIGTQPASQSVIAGTRATFSVQLSPDVPGCFQWKRDGLDIPGAVGQHYNLITSLADDQAKFSVAISLLGGSSLMSTEATLTVANDTTPPTVVSVTRDVAGTFTVTFSEPVDMTGATNPANYAIDGANPTSATASGNSAVVLVPSTAIAACPANHSIQVGNVRDTFNNLINPNPTFVGLTLNDLLLLPINASVSWQYDDNGFELGDAWYATAYDDSLWSNGAPTLAFPAGEVIQAGYPVRTVLAGVRGTTYFRTHFNMPSDPSTVTNLQLQTILDDGGIYYLNGQELTRIRMPAGVVDTNTLSSASSPSDPPQILETYSVPAGALAFGDNVIAARVHRSTVGSSDTVFAAAVVAQTTGCAAERPRLAIAINGNQVTISVVSGPNGTIYRSSSLNGPWASVGAAPQTVTVGPGQEFFEIRP